MPFSFTYSLSAEGLSAVASSAVRKRFSQDKDFLRVGRLRRTPQSTDVPPLKDSNAIVKHTILIFVDDFAEPIPELCHLLVCQITLKDAFLHADAIIRANLRDPPKSARMSDIIGDEMQHGQLKPRGRSAAASLPPRRPNNDKPVRQCPRARSASDRHARTSVSFLRQNDGRQCAVRLHSRTHRRSRHLRNGPPPGFADDSANPAQVDQPRLDDTVPSGQAQAPANGRAHNGRILRLHPVHAHEPPRQTRSPTGCRRTRARRSRRFSAVGASARQTGSRQGRVAPKPRNRQQPPSPPVRASHSSCEQSAKALQAVRDGKSLGHSPQSGLGSQTVSGETADHWRACRKQSAAPRQSKSRHRADDHTDACGDRHGNRRHRPSTLATGRLPSKTNKVSDDPSVPQGRGT